MKECRCVGTRPRYVRPWRLMTCAAKHARRPCHIFFKSISTGPKNQKAHQQRSIVRSGKKKTDLAAIDPRGCILPSWPYRRGLRKLTNRWPCSCNCRSGCPRCIFRCCCVPNNAEESPSLRLVRRDRLRIVRAIDTSRSMEIWRRKSETDEINRIVRLNIRAFSLAYVVCVKIVHGQIGIEAKMEKRLSVANSRIRLDYFVDGALGFFHVFDRFDTFPYQGSLLVGIE
jgi:hypothetical protein